METGEKIVVTCALPYANGPLHVGHIRSTYLPADIYYRYLKLNKKNAVFVCATDEHGTPITVRAEKEGKTPQEIASRYHDLIKKDFDGLNINFDIFSRTSTETNTKNAQEFFTVANERGYIYVKEVDQYYCPKCKRFLPDRYVEGKCPYCGAEGARGDHCEVCGKVLDHLDEPHCLICGSTPILKKTKHWFFKLTDFKEQLNDFLSKKELSENVKNYAVTWLDKLQDWCITRDLNWGVPVPVEGAEGKVLYVWWDAPIGYISATEEWGQNVGKDGLEYWRSGKIIHFIGKDIIYHHALFWPAMLMAHGKYKLPHTIIAGEYLSLEGKKMSTSRNWVVWVSDFLQNYPADYLRYYLTIASPLNTDMDFSWNEFEARVNNELSDVLGNFVHRVLIFTKKFFNGEVPKPGEYDQRDKDVLEKINEAKDDVSKLIEQFNFMDALKKIMELAKIGNQYMNEKEPWKNEKERANVVYVCLNIVKALSGLLYPFLPSTAEKIMEQLNTPLITEWADLDSLLEPSHKIGEPSPLVKKIEIKNA